MRLYLSQESVTSVQNLLDSLKDTLDDIGDSSAERLVINGTKSARLFNALAPKSGLEDNTISGEYDYSSHKGHIKMNGPNAVYDEFGTGERGADDGHPLKWQTGVKLNPYNSGPFVSTHVNSKNGRHFWYFPYSPLPDTRYFEPGGYTEGIPSGKQMYNTLQFVKSEKKRTIAKIANEALQKYNE